MLGSLEDVDANNTQLGTYGQISVCDEVGYSSYCWKVYEHSLRAIVPWSAAGDLYVALCGQFSQEAKQVSDEMLECVEQSEDVDRCGDKSWDAQLTWRVKTSGAEEWFRGAQVP